MKPAKGLKRQASAYSSANSCRLAAMILEATSSTNAVSFKALISMWAEQYAGHVGIEVHSKRPGIPEEMQHIASCIGKAAELLKAAGAVRQSKGSLEVVNPQHLAMMARNLQVLEDSTGRAVPPNKWTQAPEVPDALKAGARVSRHLQ